MDKVTRPSGAGPLVASRPRSVLHGVCVGAFGVFPIVGFSIAYFWRPDVAAALTLIPAWCWLLPGLFSMVLIWRMPQRRLAGGVAAAWIMFSIGWIEETRSLPRSAVDIFLGAPRPSGRRVRIVSLNCASDARCLSDLLQAAPDVVLLQECPGRDRIELMAQELFGDEGSFLDGGDTALMARGRIEAQFVDRGSHYCVGIVSPVEGCDLCCVSLRLSPPPSRFDVVSPGFWKEHAALRSTHRRQLQAIMTRLGGQPGRYPRIIGGDFNTLPFDRALDEMRPALTDAFSHCGRGWGATGTNEFPLFRVDQIWADARVDPIVMKAESTRGSDHRMVVFDLTVPE